MALVRRVWRIPIHNHLVWINEASRFHRLHCLTEDLTVRRLVAGHVGITGHHRPGWDGRFKSTFSSSYLCEDQVRNFSCFSHLRSHCHAWLANILWLSLKVHSLWLSRVCYSISARFYELVFAFFVSLIYLWLLLESCVFLFLSRSWVFYSWPINRVIVSQINGAWVILLKKTALDFSFLLSRCHGHLFS